jgi:hypothetical protein
MKNESEGIRKEAVVAKFHVLSDINLEKLVKTERNISHDSRSTGRYHEDGGDSFLHMHNPRNHNFRVKVTFGYFS